MKIAENTFVEVTYTLTVDGNIVDKAEATRPLPFVFGQGMLLPKFEENLKGKEVGDKVAFTLTPEEGYGVHNPEYTNSYPRDMFKGADGKFDETVVFVGATLQLTTQEGQPLMAMVTAIGETEVTLDFNPPMAGKTLNFEVEVVGVRESKPEDMAKFMGGGCSDCGCDKEGECGEGGCGEGGCCN